MISGRKPEEPVTTPQTPPLDERCPSCKRLTSPRRQTITEKEMLVSLLLDLAGVRDWTFAGFAADGILACGFRHYASLPPAVPAGQTFAESLVGVHGATQEGEPHPALPADVEAAVDAAPTSEAVAWDATERYERVAELFYKATGMLAIGKDDISGSHNYEERTKAWLTFTAGRDSVRTVPFAPPVPPPAAPMPKVTPDDVAWLRIIRNDASANGFVELLPTYDHILALCEYALPQQGGGK